MRPPVAPLTDHVVNCAAAWSMLQSFHLQHGNTKFDHGAPSGSGFAPDLVKLRAQIVLHLPGDTKRAFLGLINRNLIKVVTIIQHDIGF